VSAGGIAGAGVQSVGAARGQNGHVGNSGGRGEFSGARVDVVYLFDVVSDAFGRKKWTQNTACGCCLSFLPTEADVANHVVSPRHTSVMENWGGYECTSTAKHCCACRKEFPDSESLFRHFAGKKHASRVNGLRFTRGWACRDFMQNTQEARVHFNDLSLDELIERFERVEDRLSMFPVPGCLIGERSFSPEFGAVFARLALTSFSQAPPKYNPDYEMGFEWESTANFVPCGISPDGDNVSMGLIESVRYMRTMIESGMHVQRDGSRAHRCESLPPPEYNGPRTPLENFILSCLRSRRSAWTLPNGRMDFRKIQEAARDGGATNIKTMEALISLERAGCVEVVIGAFTEARAVGVMEYNAASSWTRDLTREGVEPNPGPCRVALLLVLLLSFCDDLAAEKSVSWAKLRHGTDDLAPRFAGMEYNMTPPLQTQDRLLVWRDSMMEIHRNVWRFGLRVTEWTSFTMSRTWEAIGDGAGTTSGFGRYAAIGAYRGGVSVIDSCLNAFRSIVGFVVGSRYVLAWNLGLFVTLACLAIGCWFLFFQLRVAVARGWGYRVSDEEERIISGAYQRRGIGHTVLGVPVLRRYCSSSRSIRRELAFAVCSIDEIERLNEIGDLDPWNMVVRWLVGCCLLSLLTLWFLVPSLPIFSMVFHAVFFFFKVRSASGMSLALVAESAARANSDVVVPHSVDAGNDTTAVEFVDAYTSCRVETFDVGVCSSDLGSSSFVEDRVVAEAAVDRARDERLFVLEQIEKNERRAKEWGDRLSVIEKRIETLSEVRVLIQNEDVLSSERERRREEGLLRAIANEEIAKQLSIERKESRIREHVEAQKVASEEKQARRAVNVAAAKVAFASKRNAEIRKLCASEDRERKSLQDSCRKGFLSAYDDLVAAAMLFGSDVTDFTVAESPDGTDKEGRLSKEEYKLLREVLGFDPFDDADYSLYISELYKDLEARPADRDSIILEFSQDIGLARQEMEDAATEAALYRDSGREFGREDYYEPDDREDRRSEEPSEPREGRVSWADMDEDESIDLLLNAMDPRASGNAFGRTFVSGNVVVGYAAQGPNSSEGVDDTVDSRKKFVGKHHDSLKAFVAIVRRHCDASKTRSVRVLGRVVDVDDVDSLFRGYCNFFCNAARWHLPKFTTVLGKAASIGDATVSGVGSSVIVSSLAGGQKIVCPRELAAEVAATVKNDVKPVTVPSGEVKGEMPSEGLAAKIMSKSALRRAKGKGKVVASPQSEIAEEKITPQGPAKSVASTVRYPGSMCARKVDGSVDSQCNVVILAVRAISKNKRVVTIALPSVFHDLGDVDADCFAAEQDLMWPNGVVEQVRVRWHNGTDQWSDYVLGDAFTSMQMPLVEKMLVPPGKLNWQMLAVGGSVLSHTLDGEAGMLASLGSIVTLEGIQGKTVGHNAGVTFKDGRGAGTCGSYLYAQVNERLHFVGIHVAWTSNKTNHVVEVPQGTPPLHKDIK